MWSEGLFDYSLKAVMPQKKDSARHFKRPAHFAKMGRLFFC
jgi:hypothetical protein